MKNQIITGCILSLTIILLMGMFIEKKLHPFNEQAVKSDHFFFHQLNSKINIAFKVYDEEAIDTSAQDLSSQRRFF